MFKNYCLATWNNLRQSPLYTLVNLVGLSVGFAVCLLIFLFLKDELGYDRHWERTEDLYRVNYSSDNNGTGTLDKSAYTPLIVLPLFKEYFSDEIESGTRVLASFQDVTYEDATIEQRIARVDPDFTTIFSMETLAGDLEATLQQPDRIALSEEVATRIFGRNNPIGEVLTVTVRGVSSNFEVTAVYRQPDENSMLDVPAFYLLNVSAFSEFFQNSWQITAPAVYVRLNTGADAGEFNARLPEFIERFAARSGLQNIAPETPTSERMALELQNITELYLNSPWDTISENIGNRQAVYSFAAVAILVLLIANLNFIILTTAKAGVRAKEIALRKVVGAGRRQLFVQFTLETWTLVVIAMLLAWCVVEMALPLFNAFTGKSMLFSDMSGSVFSASLVLLLLAGIAGGGYPAIFMSGFKPARILAAGETGPAGITAFLRNVMVVFQFSISIGLLIAVAVINTQIQLSLNRDLGFNKDNLMTLEIDAQYLPNATALRDRLLQSPLVSDAALSHSHPPASSAGYYSVAYYPRAQGEPRQEIKTMDIGENFFSTYQIPFLAGRGYIPGSDGLFLDDFSDEPGEYVERNLVLNEAAVRSLGFDSPIAGIGEYVYLPNVGDNEPREMRFTIIGVVADSQFFSLNAKAQPYLYHFAPAYIRYLTLRYDGNLAAVNQLVEESWREVMGDAILNRGFVGDFLVAELQQERLEARILTWFAVLAILIACIGLYGISTFAVERKAREIGIRKAFGAAVREIISLTLWQFSKPVLLANLLAWPITTWFMLDWLQRFPYQMEIWLLVPFCVVAGLVALLISTITVAANTWKIASVNPLHALKYE